MDARSERVRFARARAGELPASMSPACRANRESIGRPDLHGVLGQGILNIARRSYRFGTEFTRTT